MVRTARHRQLDLSLPAVAFALFGAACTGTIGAAGSSAANANGGDDNGSSTPGDGGHKVGVPDPGGSGGGGGQSAAPLQIRNSSLGITCDQKTAGLGSTPLVRLTQAEYNNTLTDLLNGMATVTPQVLAGETAVDGFVNNAKGQTSSSLLIETYESSAGTIAAAAVDKIMGCTPASATDESTCLENFLSGFAKKAFRHPLSDDEKTAFRTAFTTQRKTDDFKTSMTTLLAGLFQSPQFLYKVEYGTTTSGTSPRLLSGYEMASRLSYLLWDTMPDTALFAAADAGSLNTVDGIEAQFMRLIADPRAKGAMVDFSSQWLDFARFEKNLPTKDQTQFPKYSATAVQSLRDGNAKFVDYVFWQKGMNLQTLLTDTTAFINDSTAWIYGATTTAKAPALGQVTLDPTQRIGFMTQAGVLSGLGHETLPGPIIRGVFVLDQLLCAPPPPPPANVNTIVPPAMMGSAATTLRQRIVAQHEVGSCKGCHTVIDGVGFGFESYDAVGQYRTKEADSGLPVDPSATIAGTYDADGQYPNGIAMMKKLAASEQVAECVTTQWFKYTMARSLEQADGCQIASLTDGLVSTKGDMSALLLALVKSDQFRYRQAPVN